ncbi:MAG: 30S ribosomal protein S7 [Candidatus Aegiribacteria sp.]|nr:30S ribosomal protein S7 [Candidatus Aegiribacteria sp.]MBD3295681.1 30S ribosomal protein S7 [Candidatus Fermentibacteria bacterium]
MARRSKPKKREASPDRKYGNLLMAKFINKLMEKGKKSIAERIFYDAMDIITEKTGQDPVTVFNRAMGNVRPQLKVKSRRVGGSTYQVPMEVKPHERDSLAMSWIIQFASNRSGRGMADKLANEIMNAAKGENAGSVKKKEDTHRMAEANKAFAHYRW